MFSLFRNCQKESLDYKTVILNLKNENLVLKNTIQNYEKILIEKKKHKETINQLIEKVIADLYDLDTFNRIGEPISRS
jgi:hypothetical protein